MNKSSLSLSFSCFGYGFFQRMCSSFRSPPHYRLDNYFNLLNFGMIEKVSNEVENAVNLMAA